MNNKIMIETSARHIHVSNEDLKTLFGPDAKLTIRKELSQPGQYASNEKVDVVGPKSTFKGVTILGPERKQTQVEVSASDARALGVAAPVRESGDLKGSAACKLVGPAGEVDLAEGLIVAKRHIHIQPEIGKELGIEEKEIIQVKINSDNRSLIFDDVVCRVSPDFRATMHIDVDESNAAGCSGDTIGEIIKKK